MPIPRLDMMQTPPPATAYTLLRIILVAMMAAFFIDFTDAPIIAAVISVAG